MSRQPQCDAPDARHLRVVDTPEGRVVAVFLMMAGVGLAATFAGLLASWFIGSAEEEESQRELAALRADVNALRQELGRKSNARGD